MWEGCCLWFSACALIDSQEVLTFSGSQMAFTDYHKGWLVGFLLDPPSPRTVDIGRCWLLSSWKLCSLHSLPKIWLICFLLVLPVTAWQILRRLWLFFYGLHGFPERPPSWFLVGSCQSEPGKFSRLADFALPGSCAACVNYQKGWWFASCWIILSG